jgi:hypothetical protein
MKHGRKAKEIRNDVGNERRKNTQAARLALNKCYILV